MLTVPHFIEGFIIAPMERDNTIEEIIFSECITNNKDNKTVLDSMNLLTKELTPFIIVLMKGQNTCLNLDSYIDSSLIAEKGNLS